MAIKHTARGQYVVERNKPTQRFPELRSPSLWFGPGLLTNMWQPLLDDGSLPAGVEIFATRAAATAAVRAAGLRDARVYSLAEARRHRETFLRERERLTASQVSAAS